jgi:molybdopterin-guanine dinucleotide biosynthesis protein A
MGRNKALLPFGESTLLEAVVARLREACGDDLVLVTNTPEDYRHLGIPMVSDALPSGQSLVGIYTGIARAGGPAFVCGCDMPFLSPALIRYMVGLVPDVDIVIPRHGGEFEPLHAIYTPACLEPIRRCIERQGRSADIVHEVRSRVVEAPEIRRFDPGLRSFLNVNTPEEYACALKEGRAGMTRA